jgi:hypothetical protein
MTEANRQLLAEIHAVRKGLTREMYDILPSTDPRQMRSIMTLHQARAIVNARHDALAVA